MEQEQGRKRKLANRTISDRTVPEELLGEQDAKKATASKRPRDEPDEDANPRETKRPTPPPDEDKKDEDSSPASTQPATEPPSPAPAPKIVSCSSMVTASHRLELSDIVTDSNASDSAALRAVR